MTIKVTPPPIQIPSTFLSDKQAASFFNGLLNTVYQLWTAVYGMEYSAKVTTTDATTTALVKTNVADGQVVMLDCRIVARRTGGTSGTVGDGAFYVLTGAYKNVAGTLTGIGTPSTISGEDQPAWAVGFTSVGTEVVVTVTGAAGNTVLWKGTLSVYEAGA